MSGEQVHLMFATIPSVIGHIRSGKLRALAVSSLKRTAAVPELPTVAESGYPGFDASSWFGLVGPAGLPKEISTKIHLEVSKALKNPELRQKFVVQAADPVVSTPDEFAAYMRAETEKWAMVVKAT